MVPWKLDTLKLLIVGHKEKSLFFFFALIIIFHFLIFYSNVGSKMRLFGDETVYYKNSKFIEQLIEHKDTDEKISTIIKGITAPLFGEHFMPGSSLILALPQLFTDKVRLLRLTILLINVSLIISTAVFIFKCFSPLRSIIFLFLMASIPLNSLGAIFIWNDFLCGNILLVSYVLFAYATSDSITTQSDYRNIFISGILLGMSFLFRYNTVAIVFFLGLLFVFDLVVRPLSFQYFIKSSLGLFLGFLLFYSPWLIASSIKTDQLMFVPKPPRKYEIKTWTISPPMEELLGYRKSPQYLNKIRQLMETHKINEQSAAELILKDVEQTSTLRSRIRAYRTNFDNFFRNPNQFLGVMMYKTFGGAKGNWSVDVTVKPLIGYHTDGGQYFPEIAGKPYAPNRYLQPKSKLQRLYLQWNDIVYGLLIAFLFASFCVTLSTRAILLPGPSIWPFILGLCLLPLFHPAHGRYIFALMPILIYAASHSCESLINLWRKRERQEIKAVFVLTSLFFLFVML